LHKPSGSFDDLALPFNKRRAQAGAQEKSEAWTMRRIVVVGAGEIGAVIAGMLDTAGDYRVSVVDRSAERLAGLTASPAVRRIEADAADPDRLRPVLQDAFAVLNAAPYRLTEAVARAAFGARAHYLDLTEDTAGARAVRALAATADKAFIPQCGLAPGFVTIVANDLVARFDEVLDVSLSVGALPQFPTNSLGYNLTWSTEGLINEYCEPCEAIVDGRRCLIQPLEDCEAFALDGIAYEAFNTSGGLGSLCETLEGRVRNLSYRTIRYPGHAALMKTLLGDLRLRERRDLLKDILEAAVPRTTQDVVILFVSATGRRRGRLTQETYAHKIYAGEAGGARRSAIQITTASSLCAVLDLLAEGRLPQSGFVRQEDVPLQAFLDNRFGRAYLAAPPDAPTREAA
jgi:saccharopine dehydrogenase-like NADP-dependent oxidoreductase